MTKIESLVKYADKLKERLESKDIPAKHVGREASYKEFLKNDLTKTLSKISQLKTK